MTLYIDTTLNKPKSSDDIYQAYRTAAKFKIAWA
jgi:hypothetical protein